MKRTKHPQKINLNFGACKKIARSLKPSHLKNNFFFIEVKLEKQNLKKGQKIEQNTGCLTLKCPFLNGSEG